MGNTGEGGRGYLSRGGGVPMALRLTSKGGGEGGANEGGNQGRTLSKTDACLPSAICVLVYLYL